jgi:hypothetical protein
MMKTAYRSHVSVTRGGDVGEILSLMASGRQVSHDSADDARAATAKFARLANEVVPAGDQRVYGVVYAIDEENRCIVEGSEHVLCSSKKDLVEVYAERICAAGLIDLTDLDELRKIMQNPR